MPLIRKPDSFFAPPTAPAAVLESLTRGTQEERWAAARAVAAMPGACSALAAALRVEKDAHVREAMFSSLARDRTAESAAEVTVLLRSDDANLRTGALDALRIIVVGMPQLLGKLLQDEDIDVRILSCELARSLPNAEASALLCEVLAQEPQVNVCAAAIDVLAEVGAAEALPALSACAQRFRDTPFLVYAIKIVVDRINASPAPTRG